MITLSHAALLSFTPSSFAEFGKGDVRVLYHSKYVSEGRDNLDSGSLGSLEANMHLWHGVTTNFWHGESLTSQYSETKYSLGYGLSRSGVNVALGITHLEFSNYPNDLEMSVAIATESLPVTLAAQYVYANIANAAFLEMTMTHGWTLSERASLGLELLFAIDLGFATPQHDGSNNLQLGLDYSTRLNEQLELLAYVRHSFAGEDIDREQLNDQSWAGLGFSYQF